MPRELDERGSTEIIGPSQPSEPQHQPIVHEPSPPRQHREGKAPVPPKPQKKKREGPDFDSPSSSEKEQRLPEDQPRDSLRLKADPNIRAAYGAQEKGGDAMVEELERRFDVTEEDLEAEEAWFNRDQANARLAEARSRRESEEMEREGVEVEETDSGSESGENEERETEEGTLIMEEIELEDSESNGEEEKELTEIENIKMDIGEILENYEMGATLNDIIEAAREVRGKRRRLVREEMEKQGEMQEQEERVETETERRNEEEVVVI